jgi:alpha-galactosidase
VSEAADSTVVFLYQVRGLVGAGMRRARLHGLVPDRRYRRDEDGVESTGAALMAAGVPIDLLSSTATQRHPGLDWRSRVQVWRSI